MTVMRSASTTLIGSRQYTGKKLLSYSTTVSTSTTIRSPALTDDFLPARARILLRIGLPMSLPAIDGRSFAAAFAGILAGLARAAESLAAQPAAHSGEAAMRVRSSLTKAIHALHTAQFATARGALPTV